LTLSACGGGGGGAAPRAIATQAPAVTSPTPGPAGFAPVSFTIALPTATSASARKALFVPTATTQISVSVNGTTPQLFACTPPTCTGTFQAPAGGSVNFVFSTLDAQSRVAAKASLTQTIASNGTNVLAVTLNGVVDHATLSVSPAGLGSAVSGQAIATIAAFDVEGDAITGTYASPVVVTTNDATGTVTGSTFAGSASTGTVAYTYSPATAYVENHLVVSATSPTMSVAAPTAALEVGRTFYTYTANSVVGFAPGATSPTITIPIAPPFANVSSLACDGTNLYIADGETGKTYGFVPGAPAPTIAYSADTTDLRQALWVAAYGGGAQPGNRAQLYVASNGGSGLVGFQGPTSAPPFAIPPVPAVQLAVSGGSRSSIDVDRTGNLYASIGGAFSTGSGYEVWNPTLPLTLIASGTNINTINGSGQIAIDTTVTPARIYTEDISSASLPEISEYDNFSAAPTFLSPDSSFGGLFVDPSGRVYTSSAATPGVYDVYAAGGLNGPVLYTISGTSLAFDSASYVYAVNGGAITVYAPGGTTVAATIPGTTYAPGMGSRKFGTFCR
jgi:hypothetical protein